MAPKIAGAWNLHRLTAEDALDFFVLFSSAATLLGSPGQSNYSAANAFLDALAHERRRRGLPALSINWGAWSEVGLAARPDRGGRLALRGFASMTPEQGVAAFGALLGREEAQVAVMPFDFEQWAKFYPSAAESPFFAEVGASDASEATEGAEKARPDSGIVERLREVEGGTRRRALLETYLQEQVAHVLKLSPSRIDPHKSFGSFGLDSLMALEFRNRLEAGLNQSFSATMVWNHPTVTALAAHVAAKLSIDLNGDEAPHAAEGGAQANGNARANGGDGVPATDDDLELLLGEIEELSDEEAERIVAEVMRREEELS
jgi:acyl carrier protein